MLEENRSMPDVLQCLTVALTDRAITYQLTEHAPVFTSTEAAAIRGVSLHSGAKALILKGGEAFLMVVLPADLSLDSAALREVLGTKRIRFADKDEVLTITGLTPGSIPPFGSLFGLPTYCDDRLADNERINFNAGSHTVSIQMNFSDYVVYEKPTLVRVGK
jgi:Ala-tRNA(Pro) deacylase